MENSKAPHTTSIQIYLERAGVCESKGRSGTHIGARGIHIDRIGWTAIVDFHPAGAGRGELSDGRIKLRRKSCIVVYFDYFIVDLNHNLI